jgi:hypothetical protein
VAATPNLHNWRRDAWKPGVTAAGLDYRKPYALRHTSISECIAAGIATFEIARMAGTSALYIEKPTGTCCPTRSSAGVARWMRSTRATRPRYRGSDAEEARGRLVLVVTLVDDRIVREPSRLLTLLLGDFLGLLDELVLFLQATLSLSIFCVGHAFPIPGDLAL